MMNGYYNNKKKMTMKKRMMLIVTAALLGFGTAAAATYDMPMGRFPSCGMAGMQQQFELSDSQRVQMRKVQRKQWTLAAAERRALILLNRELRTESLKATPDKQKIEGITKKIGAHHAAMARLKSSHLAEVSSILTPEQRNDNEEMLYCPPMGGGSGMRGGCGAGMQRGCGMMY